MCDDPEPLCDECAKQHSRQKICRDHEMCKDIQEFLNSRSNIWYVRFFYFNLAYKTNLIDTFQCTHIMHKLNSTFLNCASYTFI